MPQVGMRHRPPEKPHRLWKEKILDEILSAIDDGAYPGTAARAAGVARTIWEEWLRWGRAGFAPYAEFVAKVEQSEAKACVWHIRNMKRCAQGDNVVVLKNSKGDETGVRTVGDWRPSTWWLSRKFVSEWSEKDTLRQAAEEALEKDEMQLPLDLLERYIEKIGFRLVPLEPQAGAEPQAAKDPH